MSQFGGVEVLVEPTFGGRASLDFGDDLDIGPRVAVKGVVESRAGVVDVCTSRLPVASIELRSGAMKRLDCVEVGADHRSIVVVGLGGTPE